MLKVFYSFRDINNSTLKYEASNDYTAVMNDSPMGDVLGEIAVYDKILGEAKLMGYDVIGTAQIRRHLDLPTLSKTNDIVVDPNKVYHTWFWTNGTNAELWRRCHPQAAGLFEAACQVIVNKWPEYKNAVETVYGTNLLFPHNMWVMTRDKFERYSQWLMFVLGSLNLPPEPSKVGSLLAERLFTIWVMQNFAMKDQVWVTAKAYDKVTGKELDGMNGVAD